MQLVSVVMATFNEKPEIIGLAIESILNQTYKNLELIIVDDSTSEETLCRIRSYLKDTRVLFVHNEERLGFVASLNKGLSLAKGTFIARMDGDDVCTLDRFEKQIAFLNQNLRVSIVGGQTEIINSNGDVISKRHYPTSVLMLSIFSCYRCPLAHSTVVMRREIYDNGIQYDESLPASEDLDLWLRAMYSGYLIANVPDNVLQFRISDDFAEKRSSEKEVVYTAMVRKKNFSSKHIVHWLGSYFLSRIYLYMPSKWLATMHNRQNRQ